VWALEKRKVFAVIPRDVNLDVDPSSFFGSEAWLCVRRVGSGFGDLNHASAVNSDR
jgi:hypothetical protein